MNAPKGKHIFGTVKVGEKGQIVIPKEARIIFDIKAGDSLVLIGDEKQGLALMKNEKFIQIFEKALQEENDDGKRENQK